MLEFLRLENVGPSPEMELEFAPRLNLITGDNGLGKSFLLDVAWWALTRRWPAQVNRALTSTGLMARPSRRGPARIEFSFQGKSKKTSYTSRFDRDEQAWIGPPGRPANPGLVLYAQVDGGFSVWDPHRNYWKTVHGADVQERVPAYVFTARQVWRGLPKDDEFLCNGLLADWAIWQKEDGDEYRQLKAVLRALSPAADEHLEPGELTKLSIDDSRWMPTLHMPYGQDVPVVLASAAMKRIIALAYLLVWSWQEHRRAAKLLDKPPTHQVTFLIDEVECHLHPRWQRTIIRALLEVMGELAGDAQVQVIAATQSPLLLASVEPFFDPDEDAWFDLDLEGKPGEREVVLRRRPFVRRGEVSNWLTSEAFDLHMARSLEAEKLLKRAAVALSDEDFDRKKARELDRMLREVLGDTDPFWMRWRFVGEKRGWLPGQNGASKQGRVKRKKTRRKRGPKP